MTMTSRWLDLSEQVETLAERIAACEEQEIVDGSLSIEKVGEIFVFDEGCKEERLVLRLEELVDDLLSEENREFLGDDDSEVAAVLQEWAALFRKLADRIEAASSRAAQ